MGSTNYIKELIDLLCDKTKLYEEIVKILGEPLDHSNEGHQNLENEEEEQPFDQEIYNNLSIQFSLFSASFFKYLNASILTGEYFTLTDASNEAEELDIQLKEFVKLNKNILSTAKDGNYYDQLTYFFDVLEKAIDAFKEFVKSLKLKVSSEKKIYISISESERDLYFNPFFLDDDIILYTSITNYYRLFKLNLLYSKNEFVLQSKDFDKLLIDIVNDIKWIDTTNSKTTLLLSEPIKLKCVFLWKKITFRKSFESKQNIIYWDGIKEVDLLEETFSRNPFINWITNIKRHYELDGLSKTKEYTLELKNKLKDDITLLTLYELHILIKYYKDCTVESYHEELKAIRIEIGNRYLKEKQALLRNSYNVFALDYNYSINNEFSELLDFSKRKFEYSAIKALYEEICKVQTLTGIDNYFPQWKMLTYLLESIQNDIIEKKVFSNLSNINFLMSEAKAILEKYDYNIEWSQRTYNYVFYLPLEECFVRYSDEKDIIDKLFIASSFVLPLAKDKYILEYKDTIKNYYSLEKSMEVIELIHTDQRALREKYVELSNDIKGKETKYIEILGIFAVVITFAAAAFTTELTMAKDPSYSDLNSGLIRVGFVLFLFVGLILFITRIPLERIWIKAEKLKLQRFGIGFLMCLLTLIFSVIINYLIFVHINPSSVSNRNHTIENSNIKAPDTTCIKVLLLKTQGAKK